MKTGTVRDLLLMLRLHIVMIAIFGALVFGWLITGRYLWAMCLWAGLDWLLVNLMNRISDIPEDMVNDIPATRRVMRFRKILPAIYVALLLGSFAFSIKYYPALTGWRMIMQAMGLLYNFRIVPVRRGWTRLKEIYFCKNFMSALGFIVTGFCYPLALVHWHPLMNSAGVVVLILYFIPFELSYEILYDLRDIEGDRALGVPTYPVVHGVQTTRRIIQILLVSSIAIQGLSFVAGFIGIRELLMAAGPLLQYFIYRPLLRRTPAVEDCIRVTNYGVAMLIVYLLSTYGWIAAGLPENIFLRY